jgi:undecaprenyl phosphate N,N'-diacetylbacillosamine 1-phosphate transferase
MSSRRIYKKHIKKPMDFLVAIAFLIKMELGSPVLFKKKRPGLNERIFTLYTFRTMTTEKDQATHLTSPLLLAC